MLNKISNIIYSKMKILITILLVLFGNRLIISQEAKKDSISYNLPEIVVISSPIPTPSPNIIQEFNVKDFESWNAFNAAEILSHPVGVNVQIGTSSGGARVLVRGFRQRDCQVFFDGIPIASAYFGEIDLNGIPINNISKIKIVKGAASVIYGINAMGGVIDIVPPNTNNSDVNGAEFKIGKNKEYSFLANYGNKNRWLFSFKLF